MILMVRALLFLSICVFSLNLQAGSVDKKLLKQANTYFGQGQYTKAAPLLSSLINQDPDNVEYQYKYGVCLVNVNSREKEGLDVLKAIETDKGFPLKDYYIGLGYFYSLDFDNAFSTFSSLRSQENIGNYISEDEIELLISNCKNAQKLWRDSSVIKIWNIGKPVNTLDGMEYVPVITPDETMMIYTYKGPLSKGGKMNAKMNSDSEGDYFEDVMVSYRINGKWQQPEGIKEINTKGHDASIALSADGHQLFVYKSDYNNPGDIYLSYYIDSAWTEPEPLKGDINSSYWEGSITMALDEQTVYFSSERPGGFGGKDIYSAELQEDGSWSNVKNLGPSINTKYDDDAPYILPDKKTLYFSSRGHNSMGGFDVFYSELGEDGVFGTVVNPANPLNSLHDDRFYVLTADGQRGYFSTLNPDGDNNYDIYAATPGREKDPIVLAMVRGAVFSDSAKVNAEFKVTNLETGELEGTFRTNPETKKYSIFMNPGKKYLIELNTSDGFNTTDTLDLAILDEYVRVNYNYYFKDSVYQVPLLRLQQKLRQVLVINKEKVTKIDLDTVQVPEGVVQHIEHDFSEVTSEQEDSDKIHIAHVEGYVYKVQVAAYRNPDNFTWRPEGKYGKLETSLSEDGVTRFHLGGFTDVDDAIALHKELVALGLKDAFVTAYDSDGKRYFLFEITHYLDLHKDE